MNLSVQIMCSNCGHRSRKYRIDKYYRTEPAAEIVKAGWDSFGDAFYCLKCVKTWEKRNGKNRPLWGKAHTRERVYQVMVGDLLDAIRCIEDERDV